MAHLSHLEPFLGEDFLLVTKVVDDLHVDFIRGPKDVEGEQFPPDRLHIIWSLHHFRVLDLIIRAWLPVAFADYNFNHRLELCFVEELIIEVSILYIEGERGPLHDGDAFNLVAGGLLLDLA